MVNRKNIPADNRRINIDKIRAELAGTSNGQPIEKPVSAGGSNQSGIPPTLSQEHLQFVDGIDEVPQWLQNEVWALITRMNSLTYIDSTFDYERMAAGVRAQLRPLVWVAKISLLEMQQIEHYVGTQLRKAKKGRERGLIAPGYQHITHQELSNNSSIIDERQQGFAAQGMLQRLPGRRQDR